MTATLPEINRNTKINSKDKDLFSDAIECLKLYHQILATLPEEKWLALSYANKVLWRQIEEQQEFLEDIVKNGFIPEMEK